MERPEYLQHLTPAERAVTLKTGMALALLTNGMSVEQRMVKSGQVGTAWDALKGGAGLILALSLLGGAPLGAFAHHVDRKVSGETPEEKERLRRIQYYKDITRQLEGGLPAM